MIFKRDGFFPSTELFRGVNLVVLYFPRCVNVHYLAIFLCESSLRAKKGGSF